jgi:hypothetical protein
VKKVTGGKVNEQTGYFSESKSLCGLLDLLMACKIAY